MQAATLNTVNFKLLLAQHGGDFTRAKAAWDRILQLGRFGNVPYTYEGGVDVQGMRTMLDEKKQDQSQAVAMNVGFNARIDPSYQVALDQNNTALPETPQDLEDRIKRIEDIASGENPYK